MANTVPLVVIDFDRLGKFPVPSGVEVELRRLKVADAMNIFGNWAWKREKIGPSKLPLEIRLITMANLALKFCLNCDTELLKIFGGNCARIVGFCDQRLQRGIARLG